MSGNNNEILDLLKSHNKQILQALESQNSILKTQNDILKSIDASLKEKGGRRESPSSKRPRLMHTHKSEEKVSYGPWSISTVVTPQQRENILNRSIQIYLSRSEDALYGRCEENKLIGDTFGIWFNTHNNGILNPNQSFGGSIEWRTGGRARLLIPQIRFNDKENIMHKSGIYSLTIKYNNSKNSTGCLAKEGSRQEAGIIIGEISFDSDGYATAEGADWDRLLNGQRQTQLPYAHGARGQPTWLSRKISEPWNDGVELKFRIDTNENTIVFQKGDTPKKVFWNVLSFTNNRTYPEFLKVFAYCGGNGVDTTADNKVSLTITDNRNINEHD